MGIDLKSIAVPLRADAIRAIRADAALWAVADEHPPFGRVWGDEPVPEISRALVAALPAGTGWVDHFGDRSFHQAEYLLDPAAYREIQTWRQRERSLPYRIVNGDEVFAEHARSGQGFVWRCSTAAFLTEAVAFLAEATARIDGLDASACGAEMHELGIYKADPDGRAFDGVLAQLRAFTGRCRDVAAGGLDLIITRY